jgi:hypothetical protein
MRHARSFDQKQFGVSLTLAIHGAVLILAWTGALTRERSAHGAT